LEKVGDNDYTPRVFKVSTKDRLKFTNYILNLSHERQLTNLISRLADLIGNMYPITDFEAKEYIRRVAGDER
jgi:type III restriction enzyme